MDTPLRALVVDDVEVDRIVLVASLKRAGFADVRFARDSTTAVQIINDLKSNIDLIVMDIELPDVNGLRVCKLVRSVPSCANIPIVVLTSHTEEPYWTEAYEAGVDDFLVKPVRFPKYRFIYRFAQKLRRLRDYEPAPAASVAPASTAGLETALYNRYAYALDAPVEKHTKGSLSIIHMQPLAEGIPVKKVQKILRAILLSAVYQSVKVINNGDSEFLILLPQDDAIRTQTWLSQIRDGMLDIAYDVPQGESGPKKKEVYRFATATLNEGDPPQVKELLKRLAISIHEGERHAGG